MQSRHKFIGVGTILILLLVFGVSQLQAQGEITLESLARRVTTLTRRVTSLSTDKVDRSEFQRLQLKVATVEAKLETLQPRSTNTPTRPRPTATQTRPRPTATYTRVRPTSTPAPVTPFVTITRSMNVRRGPGTQFGIVGTAQVNEKFDITGKTSAGDWWRIDYEGQNAWIYAPYVQATNGSRIQVVPTPTRLPLPTPQPTATQGVQVSVETYALALIKLDYEVIDSSKWRAASQEDRDQVVRTIARLLIATAAYCDLEVVEVATILDDYAAYLERLGFAARNEYAPRVNLLVLFTQKYVDFEVRRTDSCEEMMDEEVERVLREVG